MRKLVSTALLLVFLGACAAAWLSSSTPEGSAIGDINLADERTPGLEMKGSGVPPRPGSTSLTRSLAAGGSRPTAALPDVVPEMTIASGSLPTGRFDAPALTRRSFTTRGTDSFTANPRRTYRGSSESRGFSSMGFGGGSVGGGGGGAPSAVAAGTATTRNATTFTTLTGKPIADGSKPPQATPAPAARPTPRPPSNGGGSGSGGSSDVGGSAGSGGAPAAAAIVPPPPAVAAVVTGPLAGPPAVIGAPIGPIGPGGPTPIIAPPPDFGGSPSPSAAPEPTTMLLLGTGIAGLYRLRRHLG